jgi:hypothetical protein
MLAFISGVVPRQDGQGSPATNLPESVHCPSPLGKRVILRLHQADQRFDLIPGELPHGSLTESVSACLGRPSQAGETAVSCQQDDGQADGPPFHEAPLRASTLRFGKAVRFIH